MILPGVSGCSVWIAFGIGTTEIDLIRVDLKIQGRIRRAIKENCDDPLAAESRNQLTAQIPVHVDYKILLHIDNGRGRCIVISDVYRIKGRNLAHSPISVSGGQDVGNVGGQSTYLERISTCRRG